METSIKIVKRPEGGALTPHDNVFQPSASVSTGGRKTSSSSWQECSANERLSQLSQCQATTL